MVTTCLTQWARQSAQSWVDTTLGGIAGPAPCTPPVGAPPSKPLPPEGGGGAELTTDGLGECVCAALLCAELTFGESGRDTWVGEGVTTMCVCVCVWGFVCTQERWCSSILSVDEMIVQT